MREGRGGGRFRRCPALLLLLLLLPDVAAGGGDAVSEDVAKAKGR